MQAMLGVKDFDLGCVLHVQSLRSQWGAISSSDHLLVSRKPCIVSDATKCWTAFEGSQAVSSAVVLARDGLEDTLLKAPSLPISRQGLRDVS